MPHVVILNEGRQSGVPVWRFAASRDEAVYIHGPALREWEDALPTGPYRDIRTRTFFRSWVALNTGGYEDDQYAIYTPWSQNDLVAHCRHSGSWGVCFQVITSLQLREEHAATFSRIWRQTRPLLYLRQADICRELAVP